MYVHIVLMIMILLLLLLLLLLMMIIMMIMIIMIGALEAAGDDLRAALRAARDARALLRGIGGLAAAEASAAAATSRIQLRLQRPKQIKHTNCTKNNTIAQTNKTAAAEALPGPSRAPRADRHLRRRLSSLVALPSASG